jgi:hypothetical protein
MEWIETVPLDKTIKSRITPQIRANACMCFDKIKSEFRCEKLLLLYMFDFLFFRSNKDVKSVAVI